MSKKAVSWAVCVLVAIVVVAAVAVRINKGQTSARAANVPVLRIGAAIAMTGYGAAFGESEANAIQLLKSKYPTAEFFIEDNKSDPKAGLLAVNKLMDVHDVDIIYCDLTTVANAAVAATKDHEVVLVASVYLTDLLERSPFAVRNLPRGVDEARLLLNHLKTEHPDANSVAAVGSNDEFGRSSLSDFRETAAQAGIRVLIEESIPDEATQIGSLAQKIAATHPNAVYAASLLPSLGIFIRELRVAGFAGVIITTDAFSYPYVRSAAGEYAKGVVYVDFPSTEATEAFAARYKNAFSKDLVSTAVLCYDGLSVILDACHAHPSSTPAHCVSTYLEGWKHEGVYGKVVVRGREIIYPLKTRTAP